MAFGTAVLPVIRKKGIRSMLVMAIMPVNMAMSQFGGSSLTYAGDFYGKEQVFACEGMVKVHGYHVFAHFHHGTAEGVAVGVLHGDGISFHEQVFLDFAVYLKYFAGDLNNCIVIHFAVGFVTCNLKRPGIANFFSLQFGFKSRNHLAYAEKKRQGLIFAYFFYQISIMTFKAELIRKRYDFLGGNNHGV